MHRGVGPGSEPGPSAVPIATTRPSVTCTLSSVCRSRLAEKLAWRLGGADEMRSTGKRVRQGSRLGVQCTNLMNRCSETVNMTDLARGLFWFGVIIWRGWWRGFRCLRGRSFSRRRVGLDQWNPHRVSFFDGLLHNNGNWRNNVESKVAVSTPKSLARRNNYFLQMVSAQKKHKTTQRFCNQIQKLVLVFMKVIYLAQGHRPDITRPVCP